MGAGQPAKYSTSEELQSKVDKYFESGYRKKKMYSYEGREYEVPAITMTDLAIFLGFESRQSLYDYDTHEQFSYIIKRARTFIEREYEERLLGNSPTGAIFALKNMGWKDKSEIDQKTEMTVNGIKAINISVGNE